MQKHRYPFRRLNFPMVKTTQDSGSWIDRTKKEAYEAFLAGGFVCLRVLSAMGTSRLGTRRIQLLPRHNNQPYSCSISSVQVEYSLSLSLHDQPCLPNCSLNLSYCSRSSMLTLGPCLEITSRTSILSTTGASATIYSQPAFISRSSTIHSQSFSNVVAKSWAPSSSCFVSTAANTPCCWNLCWCLQNLCKWYCIKTAKRTNSLINQTNFGCTLPYSHPTMAWMICQSKLVKVTKFFSLLISL